MKEQFLTYEQSLAVKELGFDESCMGYFQYDVEKKYNSEFYYHKPNVDCSWNPLCKNSLHPKEIETNAPKVSAPLKSQFFKWARDKKLTDASINRHGTHDGGYSYRWDIVHEYGVYEERHFKLGYKTYEEAEEACINEVIEILKERQ